MKINHDFSCNPSPENQFIVIDLVNGYSVAGFQTSDLAQAWITDVGPEGAVSFGLNPYDLQTFIIVDEYHPLDPTKTLRKISYALPTLKR